MRDVSARCEDILDAIDKIELERIRGKDVFDADEKVQVWMVHHLMIIGEAVRGSDQRKTSRNRMGENYWNAEYPRSRLLQNKQIADLENRE